MAIDIILLFLASFGAAILAHRLARRGPLARADISIGVIGGLAGVSLAQLLGAEGAGWSLGLPLLLATCLAIGLESLQDHPVQR
jgi:hypothetical protein